MFLRTNNEGRGLMKLDKHPMIYRLLGESGANVEAEAIDSALNEEAILSDRSFNDFNFFDFP
jgi:hypothetical protein